MNKIMQTATTSSHVTSTVDKPLTAVDCNTEIIAIRDN